MLALAAGSMAILFLPPAPVQILAPAVLLLLLLAVETTRVPYLLVAAAPALLAPDPVGPWLGASALAVLMAMPHAGRATDLRTHAPALVGGLLLAAGAFFAPIPASVGLVAGLAGRAVVQHPGRPRLAASLGRTGTWAALVPAAVLLLLAALGRVPTLGPRPLLLVGWSAVGVGALAAAVVLGIEVGLRSSGRAPARAAALPLVAFGIPLAALATGALTDAVLLLGIAWAVVPPYAAVGVGRVARAAGARRHLVGLGALLAAFLALAVRILH